jgi:hypothetical protein
MSRTAPAIVLAALTAAALAACGSSSDGSSPASASPAATLPSATASAAPETELESTQAQPAHETIDDFLAKNGITETPIAHQPGQPPFADFQLPDGWEVQAPAALPAHILAFAPEYRQGDFVPSALLVVSKLDRVVDPAQILPIADGELRNQPSFEEVGAFDSDIDGYPARSIIGTYRDPDLGLMAASQQTVIVPGAPGEEATYVVQLNVTSLENQADAISGDVAKINGSMMINM